MGEKPTTVAHPTGPNADITSGIAALQQMGRDNRAFQVEAMKISIMMNVDNKLAQQAGNVAK